MKRIAWIGVWWAVNATLLYWVQFYDPRAFAPAILLAAWTAFTTAKEATR
jgi:hypothetical protein